MKGFTQNVSSQPPQSVWVILEVATRCPWPSVTHHQDIQKRRISHNAVRQERGTYSLQITDYASCWAMHLLNTESDAESLEMSGDLGNTKYCILFCICCVLKPTALHSPAEAFFSVMSFSFCRNSLILSPLISAHCWKQTTSFKVTSRLLCCA